MKRDTRQENKKKQSEDIVQNAKDSGAKPFPVDGIGASAGGVEAVSGLLDHLPPDLNMAYVVIQHLSPSYDSILPEILQKRTKMPVHRVVDGMPVEANNVYVIPPDAVMSIVDGHLTLSRLET